MHFMYLGFSQQANIRHYRFQGVIAGERPTRKPSITEIAMHADMALLAQFRVRVQDGPALCLQILAAALSSAKDNLLPFASYDVSAKDLTVFASARNAVDEAKAARRRPRPAFRPSSAPSKWPHPGQPSAPAKI